MLRQLPLVACLLFSTACFFPGSRTGRHHHHRVSESAAVAGLVADAVVIGIVLASAAESPSSDRMPPPPPDTGAFDQLAARRALLAVPYKDCGVGGVGHLMIAFAPNGTVSSATLLDGDFTEETEACVTARFESATMPPFAGNYHRVRWTIEL